MSGRTSTGALVRLAGWALPILAGLLFAPSARAGCGDYVVTRLSPAGMASSPEHAVANEPPIPSAPKPARPCRGSHCSQTPAAPAAPAPSVPTQPTEEWGCVHDGLLLAPLEPAALLAEQHTAPPVRSPSGIFHPPRRS